MFSEDKNYSEERCEENDYGERTISSVISSKQDLKVDEIVEKISYETKSETLENDEQNGTFNEESFGKFTSGVEEKNAEYAAVKNVTILNGYKSECSENYEGNDAFDEQNDSKLKTLKVGNQIISDKEVKKCKISNAEVIKLTENGEENDDINEKNLMQLTPLEKDEIVDAEGSKTCLNSNENKTKFTGKDGTIEINDKGPINTKLTTNVEEIVINNNDCCVLQKHAELCRCSTPRLHVFLLLQHKCKDICKLHGDMNSNFVKRNGNCEQTISDSFYKDKEIEKGDISKTEFNNGKLAKLLSNASSKISKNNRRSFKAKKVSSKKAAKSFCLQSTVSVDTHNDIVDLKKKAFDIKPLNNDENMDNCNDLKQHFEERNSPQKNRGIKSTGRDMKNENKKNENEHKIKMEEDNDTINNEVGEQNYEDVDDKNDEFLIKEELEIKEEELENTVMHDMEETKIDKKMKYEKKEIETEEGSTIITDKEDRIDDKEINMLENTVKNNLENTRTKSKRKELFRINKNGPFHSFNGSQIVISSVRPLDGTEKQNFLEHNETEISKVWCQDGIKVESESNSIVTLPSNASGDHNVQLKPNEEIKSIDVPMETTPDLLSNIKSEPVDTEDSGINLASNSHAKQIHDDGLEPLRKRSNFEENFCKFCLTNFPNFLQLSKHLDEHQKEGIIFCVYCQRTFSEKSNLKRHLRIHTGEKPYQCKVCDKRFSLPGNFKKHRDIHENIRSQPCKICGKSFRRKEHLKYHLRTHTGEKPFNCSICSSSFTARYSLQIHMNIHLGKKPYECHDCSKAFSDKSTLRKHIRTHTGERPFACKICHKSFRESGTLASHIATHSQERPHSCQHCKLSFKTSGGLRQHNKIHTNGAKKFSCRYCPVRFKKEFQLVTHEKTHEGQDPFACTKCGGLFRSKSSLRRHALSHDKAYTRKFTCDQCDKQFFRKSHLTRHLSSHLKLKEYLCSICDKKLSTAKSLKNHEQSFHRGETQ